MANDAYDLQGQNGLDLVDDGQAFAVTDGCKTRGFQVAVSGTFTYKGTSPKGGEVEFTNIALDPPSYIGGPLHSLVVSGGGQAAVFPTSKSYTIG